MKKKQKTKQKAATGTKERTPQTSVRWPSIYAAFRDAFERAFDNVVHSVADRPEDVAAVERVRSFVRQQGLGTDTDVSLEEVLFAFGLIVMLYEVERYIDRSESRAPWSAVPLEPPSAADLWDRTITRHLHTAQQLASPLRSVTA